MRGCPCPLTFPEMLGSVSPGRLYNLAAVATFPEASFTHAWCTSHETKQLAVFPVRHWVAWLVDRPLQDCLEVCEPPHTVGQHMDHKKIDRILDVVQGRIASFLAPLDRSFQMGLVQGSWFIVPPCPPDPK